MKALVVDDHRDVAEFIAEALKEMEGMDVDIATSAASARAYSSSRQYGLFVIDVYLKGGDTAPDGLDYAKSLLAEDSKTPIILMTGKSYSKIITSVIVKTGTTVLLSKPIDLTTLIDTVHKVMPDPDEEE